VAMLGIDVIDSLTWVADLVEDGEVGLEVDVYIFVGVRF
jgi:hypothetical protein